MIELSWSDFKTNVTDRLMEAQWFLKDESYHLYAFDGPMKFKCILDLDNPTPADTQDFIDNFKDSWNKRIEHLDPDTKGLATSPKFAVDGWTEQMFELEMETSKLDSIHEKDINDADIGWASLKFYKAGDVEMVQGADSDAVFQGKLDLECIRTDLAWMPNIDYMIKGGWVSQKIIPVNDIYVWAVGADLDAVYGGPQSVFLEGGLNLSFASANQLMGLDGVAATRLDYSHPALGDGKGTNRMRFIFRHPAGENHRVQVVFDIFRG